MDQKRLARLQGAAVEHVAPHGEDGLRQNGGLRHGEPLRNGQSGGFVRRAILRIAAAGDEGAHFVPHLVARGVGAQGHHRAGDLQTRNVRCAGGWRIEALALHHVGAVHTCGRHLNQHLAGAGRGHRPLGQDEGLRAAGGRDGDGVHGRRQRHGKTPWPAAARQTSPRGGRKVGGCLTRPGRGRIGSAPRLKRVVPRRRRPAEPRASSTE